VNQQINKEFVSRVSELLQLEQYGQVVQELNGLHYADIAEILSAFEANSIIEVLNAFDAGSAADVVMELDEELRDQVLEQFSPQQLAELVVDNLDSDDAADLVGELSEERKQAVIANLEDLEHAKQIVDLLKYPEDTAGGIMATELIKVNKNLTVMACVREMRRQAEDIEEVHTVYVVDDDNILLGTLSLKKLLTNSTRAQIENLYNGQVTSVKASLPSEEVGRIMRKYDLVVIPVVDDLGRLLGRITVDDILDVMQEEADRDYQLASGISENVEGSDRVWVQTRARIPWLLVGMLGGIVSAQIIGIFDLEKNLEMAYFIPLIAAMGGNVGVQSSAIIVQSLANKSLNMDSTWSRMGKELMVGLINALLLAVALFAATLVLGISTQMALTICLALIAVIIFAALFGTFIPLALNHYHIDPAIATGPFITTTNDVVGMLIYFYIGTLFF